jgi:hypothetical protein
MRVPSAIAAGSVAIALFAGGFAIGHGVRDDSSSKKTASGKASVLGQVYARTPDAATTTTATVSAPPTSSAPASSATFTTAAPSTATTLKATVISPPNTTPATVIVSGACGNGTASANVSSQTFPRTNSANTDYETDAVVSVRNDIDRAVQIDSLSIRLNLHDGTVRDVVFDGAVGSVVQPGNTAQYGVAVNTGKTFSDSVAMRTFSFHTAGHPECAGRPA